MATSHEVERPGSLERRPEAGAYKVEDLLDEVRRGRVRIPHFQRALKWKREDALQLLDSMYRGYPVGTLLLWETLAPANELVFGSVRLSGAESRNALLVVDGQQRLVSLVRTLLAPEPAVDEVALFFDLDDVRFVAPPGDALVAKDPTRWLPLTVVLDSEQLIKWLLDKVPSPQRRDAAIQLGRRVREYEIPAYTVRTDDEDVLREVFRRINTHGKQLSAGDVFDALNGARTGAKPGTLAQIAKELEELDFGLIEEKVIYRLLRVLQGHDVTERSGKGELRLKGEKAEAAYEQTLNVMRQVVLFVKREAGILHYELLPYKQPLITLGRFFQHHPQPQPRSRELLVRWLWRGALTGAHRGDTVSTRQSLAQIDASDEELSVQRMLERVGTSESSIVPAASDKFNFRHAAGKLMTLALMELKPAAFDKNQAVDVSALLRVAADTETSPLLELISQIAGGPSDGLHTVANRLFHPKIPKLRTLLADAPAPVLLSHGIDDQAVAAWRASDRVAFLAHRTAWLDHHFRQFFARRARWDESDRPSMAALVLEDEEA